VTTVAPGKLDLFVVTFIDGRRAAVEPITEYEAAVAKARAFLREHQCQIKVLPMTGTEACNLLGIAPPEEPAPNDIALRQEMVATLMRVARESTDADARGDALDLLASISAVAV
jgi:hypothetical protein